MEREISPLKREYYIFSGTDIPNSDAELLRTIEVSLAILSLKSFLNWLSAEEIECEV